MSHHQQYNYGGGGSQMSQHSSRGGYNQMSQHSQQSYGDPMHTQLSSDFSDMKLGYNSQGSYAPHSGHKPYAEHQGGAHSQHSQHSHQGAYDAGYGGSQAGYDQRRTPSQASNYAPQHGAPRDVGYGGPPRHDPVANAASPPRSVASRRAPPGFENAPSARGRPQEPDGPPVVGAPSVITQAMSEHGHDPHMESLKREYQQRYGHNGGHPEQYPTGPPSIASDIPPVPQPANPGGGGQMQRPMAPAQNTTQWLVPGMRVTFYNTQQSRYTDGVLEQNQGNRWRVRWGQQILWADAAYIRPAQGQSQGGTPSHARSYDHRGAQITPNYNQHVQQGRNNGYGQHRYPGRGRGGGGNRGGYGNRHQQSPAYNQQSNYGQPRRDQYGNPGRYDQRRPGYQGQHARQHRSDGRYPPPSPAHSTTSSVPSHVSHQTSMPHSRGSRAPSRCGSVHSMSNYPPSSAGSSMIRGLPTLVSEKRYQTRLGPNGPKDVDEQNTAVPSQPGQVAQSLMDEVQLLNEKASAGLGELDIETRAAQFESPPMGRDVDLPDNRRILVATNYYELDVNIEDLLRNLVIYEIKAEVRIQDKDKDNVESLTTILRSRRYTEQFRVVKRHFEDVTLVPPKWLYSRSSRKDPLRLKLGETSVMIIPIQECGEEDMAVHPTQQAILVERYLQDKMRDAGNICYRGDWVNKTCPETVLEAARVHKTKSPPDFDFGIRRAVRLSVKSLDSGGFALCCSPSCIVRERVPVMTILQRLKAKHSNAADFDRIVKEQINGSRVVSTHDPDKPTYHRLAVDTTVDPGHKFCCEGTEISFADYFRTRYKRPLKLDQPMHRETGKVLPTQYLHRTGSAHASSKMRQTIQRKCQQWGREDLSSELITQLNTLLKMGNVPIDIKDPIKVPGFHMESLRICGLTKFTDSRSFYEMPSHYVKPKLERGLRQWVILHTSSTYKEAQKAISIVKRKKQKERWPDSFIGAPNMICVHDLGNLNEVQERLMFAQQHDGILIILEGTRKTRTVNKARLTFLLEGQNSKIGVPCQFIDFETIRKSKAAVQNVVNPQLLYKSPKNVHLWEVQVKDKLDGMPEIDFHNDFAAFGHDICHFDTNAGKYPSVGVLSMDMAPFTADRSTVRTKACLLLPRKHLHSMNLNIYDLQPPRLLKHATKELLKEYLAAKGKLPRYQAYYFDSPAGHPSDAIKALYIPAIKEANAELHNECQIVVVVVNKRPAQRLFTQFTGIIVDSCVSSAEHREFLMKKYTPIPTQNTVLYDEWGIYTSPERVATFYYINYAMTFSYGPHDKSRRNKSDPSQEEAEGIAVQACLKYADHAARWMGEIILPEHRSLKDLQFKLNRPSMIMDIDPDGPHTATHFAVSGPPQDEFAPSQI